MNSIEKDARIETDLIYKSILDESELMFPYMSHELYERKTTDSNRQLFVNKILLSILEDQIKLKLTAQRKSIRLTNETAEFRNEEIVYKALKGTQQKKLSKDHGISIPAISKIIIRTINKILGLKLDDISAGDAVAMYRVELEKYFIQKKIEARYEKRTNNNGLRGNNNTGIVIKLADGTLG